MNTNKIWAITGAGEGLGLAAVKFLTTRQQRVIALVDNSAQQQILSREDNSFLQIINTRQLAQGDPHSILHPQLMFFGALHGIINNAHHSLFHDPPPSTVRLFKRMDEAIANNVALIKMLQPYLKPPPEGCLINLPPQLCLATIQDQAIANLLSATMTVFLNQLRGELEALGCGLHFLLPGKTDFHFEV